MSQMERIERKEALACQSNYFGVCVGVLFKQQKRKQRQSERESYLRIRGRHLNLFKGVIFNVIRRSSSIA